MAWTERYFDPDASGANDGTSWTDAWQTWADVAAGVAAGHRVNMRTPSGRAVYNTAASVTIATSGTAASPIWFRGCDSVAGDGGLALWEWAGGNNRDLSFNGDHILVEGLDLEITTDGSDFNHNAIVGLLYRCKIVWSGLASSVEIAHAVNCVFQSTHVSGDRMAVGRVNNGGVRMVGCHLIRVAVRCDTYGATYEFVNNVFDGDGIGSGDYAIHFSRMNNADSHALISGNRFYDYNSGVYINDMPDSGASEGLVICHNLFDSMARYAVEHNTAHANAANHGQIMMIGNKYRACTSGFTTLTSEGPFSDNDLLTADPFEDAANGDLDLNDNAGGGAAVRAEGYMHVNTPIDLTTLLRRPLGVSGAALPFGQRRLTNTVSAETEDVEITDQGGGVIRVKNLTSLEEVDVSVGAIP